MPGSSVRAVRRRPASWIVFLPIAAVLVAGGCKATQVLLIRLDSSNINLFYYTRGVVRLEPVGGTAFSGDRSGSWADGAVTYSVTEDGAFEIVMDGAWMQAEALANRDRYPNTFTIEFPLTHVEQSGTFHLTARYEYDDSVHGSGLRTIAVGTRYPDLELPYEGTPSGVVGLFLRCADAEQEACTMSLPDPDPDEGGTEVIDTAPDAPDAPEDAVDVSTDPDAPDTAPDTAPDPDAPPDLPEPTDVPDSIEPGDAPDDPDGGEVAP